MAELDVSSNAVARSTSNLTAWKFIAACAMMNVFGTYYSLA